MVDDSAAIRKILQRVLRQTGMAIRTIYEAGDGQEALEVLRTQKINLVLTDINMPNMDGLQLLAAIKAVARMARPAGRDDHHRRRRDESRRSGRLGAAGYVRKPFTADQIKEKLAGILEAVCHEAIRRT